MTVHLYLRVFKKRKKGQFYLDILLIYPRFAVSSEPQQRPLPCARRKLMVGSSHLPSVKQG